MWIKIECVILGLISGALPVLAQDAATQPGLEYPQSIFDSDTCCWRELSAAGSYVLAADLIKAYLRYHDQVENRHSLQWHLGQMLAMGDQYKEATKQFKKTYSVLYSWFGGADGKAWYLYAKGTVAFLERDKKKFIRLMEKWPPQSIPDRNFDMLQTLLEHWELSYREASAYR